MAWVEEEYAGKQLFSQRIAVAHHRSIGNIDNQCGDPINNDIETQRHKYCRIWRSLYIDKYGHNHKLLPSFIFCSLTRFFGRRKKHHFTSLPDDACVMQSIGWMNSSYETNDDLVLSDLARCSEFEKGGCVWINIARYLCLVYLKKKKANRPVD